MTAAVAKCAETWCTNHLEDEDGAMHATHDVAVAMTAGGRNDQHTALVMVERDDTAGGRGPAKVRLEVAGGIGGMPKGGPMTPAEALRLARELKRAALTAMRSASAGPAAAA